MCSPRPVTNSDAGTHCPEIWSDEEGAHAVQGFAHCRLKLLTFGQQFKTSIRRWRGKKLLTNWGYSVGDRAWEVAR